MPAQSLSWRNLLLLSLRFDSDCPKAKGRSAGLGDVATKSDPTVNPDPDPRDESDDAVDPDAADDAVVLMSSLSSLA